MKPRTLTVKDYFRAFSRVATPVANTVASAMTVSEYKRGREQQAKDTQAGPGRTRQGARRPSKEWAQDNTWGHDTETDRHERESWMEGTFWNDADQGVTFGESTWDGTWNTDEAWRR
jgi:hypothetical protein